MEKNFTEQRATIFVVVISSYITAFTSSALNLSIPAMASDFSVSAGTVRGVVMGYILAVVTMSVPFGRLADITQKKTVFVAGVLFFTLASFAAIFAGHFAVILTCRILQGVSGAMLFSTKTAILITAFPGSDRGKVLGYSLAATYIGLSTGPVIGGILNHSFGWRSIFILTFIISITVLFTTVKKLPAQEKASDQLCFDIPGNVLYVSMVVTAVYGFSIIAVSKVGIGLVFTGMILSVFFVKHECKTENPIIQIRLFTRNTSYTLSNIATLLNYSATYAIGYLLSIYLQVVAGYSSQSAGMILIVQPAIIAILSPFAGRLSDKVSPFKLASAGMGFCAAGLSLLAFVRVDYPLWALILALAVTGTGFALFSSPNANAVLSCVDAKDYGVVTSLLATMRSLGQTLSMVIVTFVVNIYVGGAALSDMETGVLINTIRTSFIIFLIICVVGIFISRQRKN